MKTIKFPSKSEWNLLSQRPAIDTVQLEGTVKDILKVVKTVGDEALKKYSLEFDKVQLNVLKVSDAEMKDAFQNVSEELKKAISVATNNIRKFHVSQKEEVQIIETSKGVTCWRKSIGIEKVGLYIPGGTAPLFSTLLMLGIPARLAGCKKISVCTPPDKNGNINPVILYVAGLLGITDIYKLGGAQAIAAMAYGTESVSKVYKIFGPGNQYVTCAKQLVAMEGTAIDIPAGPSELAVIADESCVPAFVAADLLSQAEHGIDSQVVLVSNSERVIDEVQAELIIQLKDLPRKKIAEEALKNSKAILFTSLKEGVEFINEYAPEHLIIASEYNEVIAEQIINAGSVFLGNYTPESAGDYASGTNHTLPTNAFAKAYSGVSLDSFVKKITFQKITEEGINDLGKTIEVLASEEGLQAHKNAVSIRIKNNKKWNSN